MPHRYSTSEDFATAVLTALKSDERSIEWLSRRTGIRPSTLRSHLLEKPARLTYQNAMAISAAALPLDEVA